MVKKRLIGVLGIVIEIWVFYVIITEWHHLDPTHMDTPTEWAYLLVLTLVGLAFAFVGLHSE